MLDPVTTGKLYLGLTANSIMAKLTNHRVFIRHRRSENSPATTLNFPAKFRSFPERALLFHNNSPVTLHYSPATTILNEIPAISFNEPDIIHLTVRQLIT